MLARIQAGRSITSTTAGPASDRNPVVVFDLILEPGDQLPEVERPPHRCDRVTPGDACGDLLSASPVDWRLCGSHDDLFTLPGSASRGYCVAVTFLR